MKVGPSPLCNLEGAIPTETGSAQTSHSRRYVFVSKKETRYDSFTGFELRASHHSFKYS